MHSIRPRLGPFELLVPIGRGASGEVWRGMHPGSGSAVAVKFLFGRRADDDLRKMQQELRAIARMDHPGIVRVHDHGQLDAAQAHDLDMLMGTPFIVMDFAGRTTLRRVLGQHPWASMRADLIALLEALAHAHARGMVHRDLKPANVLIGTHGPVLTDFGVALAFDRRGDDDGATGTPNYMAPEQVEADARAIGPWSDLYAVGCLAYALATGRPPFGGRGSIGALHAHLDEPPPMLGPRYPPAFARWIVRLMQKEPADRFAFAADAIHALAMIPADPTAAAQWPASLAQRPALPLPAWRRPTPPRPRRLAGVHRSLADLRQIDPVGRAAEQTALWNTLGRVVRRTRVEVAVIEGPTGSGGSHLARWLARRAHETGVAVGLFARHEPTGASQGLGPMLARALRVDGLTGADAVHRAARSMELAASDRAALVGAAAAHPDRRAQIGEAAITLRSHAEFEVAAALTIEQLATRHPRIVIIDDAQWAPEAIAFTRHLLAARSDMATLVVLTVVSDRLDRALLASLEELTRQRSVSVHRLEPLPADAIGEIVRRLAPAGGALVDAIVDHAQGEASRAAALLRLWSTRGALVQDDDGLRLATREPPMPVDDSTLWLDRIAGTLGDMPDAQWAALELLGTFGARIDAPSWAALARHGALDEPGALPRILPLLSDAGLLVDESDGWGLAHGRLRDALMQHAQRRGRLARWHAASAALLADLPDAASERLAHHRVAAGDHAGAVQPLIDAATQARRRTANDRVRRNLLGAAEALRASPGGRHDPRWAELHARWALSDMSRGRRARARRRAQRADRIAVGPALQALTAYVLGEATLGSTPESAEAHLLRAEKHARTAGSLRLALRCAEARAWSYHHRGAYAEVEQLTARILADREIDQWPLLTANLLFARAVAGRCRGDGNAYSHLARAATLYRRQGARHGQASVRNEMGEMALAAGEPNTALTHYRDARRIFAELGHRSVIVADLNLGRVYDALDDPREGEKHRQAALRKAEHEEDEVMSAFAAVCLLADTARRRRFERWPGLMAHLGPLRDGSLVAPEAAEAARAAGEHAREVGAYAEARAAFELAAIQFDGTGRAPDADAARAAAHVGTSPVKGEV